jgi:hypothetical protein
MSEYYDVLISEDRKNKDTGEVKPFFHRVGTMFPHRKGAGFNLVIPEGLAISGRVLILPRKGRDDAQPDPDAVSEFNASR